MKAAEKSGLGNCRMVSQRVGGWEMGQDATEAESPERHPPRENTQCKRLRHIN